MMEALSRDGMWRGYFNEVTCEEAEKRLCLCGEAKAFSENVCYEESRWSRIRRKGDL